MSRLQTYQVFPNIPKPLSFLETLSRNLWWSWSFDAQELFRRIDPQLWEEAKRNPIIYSTLISQDRLESLAADEGFLAHLDRVKNKFNSEILSPEVLTESDFKEGETIAYFSMEFGIHESLPLFAGGLGVLSGDHLKAASDQAIPIVGVGLLYRSGYFHQYLDPTGWQQEEYPETDLFHLPISRAVDHSGQEVVVSIIGPSGEVHAAVWVAWVGRIPLYLLDTNLPENAAEARNITSRLYAGEPKTRLAQEVLLGIGGMRALNAFDIKPMVCHMNEGHCAFASVGRLSQTMKEHNIDVKTALEIVPRTSVFTTHTPVQAGHDEFPVEMVRPYMEPLQDELEVEVEKIISWGQPAYSGPEGPLSMFVLALRMSQYRNGVSELHGSVARKMWSHVWPERPEDEIPIAHITNGVHIPSMISVENRLLFDRYLGPDWFLNTMDDEMVNRIDEIFDEELWHAHEMSRLRLIRACRSMLLKQYSRRNAPKATIEKAQSVLDHETLTIGFARRFATYKRANLLFSEPDRLEAMITSQDRPVQLIFAGKAHPKDEQGKELIKNLFEFAQRPSVRYRVVFIEDYDINIARYLVQGCDVWLNTPRRPYEACGTSGIKAAANGVLNLSVLDGWWCEGFSEKRGWRIGNGEEYEDHEYQDAIESQALYNLLENDVIPRFYERRISDTPEAWIQMMKASMKMALKDFGADLMINKYKNSYYLPCLEQYHTLLENQAEKAQALYQKHTRLARHWKDIKIEHPVRSDSGPFRVGDNLNITSVVFLGELLPDEVDVELYHGNLKSIDSLNRSHSQEMTVKEDLGNGSYCYTCDITCGSSGRFGFTARVTPRGDERIKFTPELLTWA